MKVSVESYESLTSSLMKVSNTDEIRKGLDELAETFSGDEDFAS